MESSNKPEITVQATINNQIEKVWAHWNEPQHITKWCFASDDWCAPKAENDLRTGGTFSTRMEAKDGSFGFDFGGTYTNVELLKVIEYKMTDDRKVKIKFASNGNETTVTETFDAENENPIEMQRGGWQAILNNFKKYSEQN